MTVVAYGVDHGIDGLLKVVMDLGRRLIPLLGLRTAQIRQSFR